LSAAWAALAKEWIVIHLGLAGVGLLMMLGGRAGAWEELTRPAWIWVVMLGLGVAVVGGLTARGRRV